MRWLVVRVAVVGLGVLLGRYDGWVVIVTRVLIGWCDGWSWGWLVSKVRVG